MAFRVEARLLVTVGLVMTGMMRAWFLALIIVLLLAALGSKPSLAASFRADASGVSNTCSGAVLNTPCYQQHMVCTLEKPLNG